MPFAALALSKATPPSRIRVSWPFSFPDETPASRPLSTPPLLARTESGRRNLQNIGDIYRERIATHRAGVGAVPPDSNGDTHRETNTLPYSFPNTTTPCPEVSPT